MLPLRTALDLLGGSLFCAGTLIALQRTGECVDCLLRWSVTLLDILLLQRLPHVASGFPLRVEGASHKTVRGWTLRLGCAIYWNFCVIMFVQSVLRSSCLQRPVGFCSYSSVFYLLTSSRREAILVPH
jgi:hypothetical protein